MIAKLPIALFVYAALLVLGGAMGTIMTKNHEIYSILGSAFFGAFAVWGAMLIRNKAGNVRTGIIIGLLDALAVAAFFAEKFATSPTHKVMPAVPAIAMSAVVIVLALLALGEASKKVAL